MTPRIVKAVRKAFGIQPVPRNTQPVSRKLARACVREGYVVSLIHDFYGPLRVLAEDSGISQHLLDGSTIWESDIVELFAQEFHRGQNVIDAGANLGLHSIALAKLATRGEKVYAFEPHPEIFPLTRYNCSRFPHVECLDKAASDEATTLYMPSVLSCENAGAGRVEKQAREGMYAVEAVTIDSLKLTNIGLMKIDVEGHEMACIRGAVQTIRRDQPTLLVEIVGGHNLQTAAPDIAAEIRSRIHQICALGYTPTQVSFHDYLFRPVGQVGLVPPPRVGG